jgi:probable rRNA maturation factor
MPLRIDVRIHPPFHRRLPSRWLREVARTALLAEGLGDGQLGIVVADDDTVRELNRTYAHEDAPTDVLSFPLQEGEEFPQVPRIPRPLGEVVISLPTAQRQAQEGGRTLQQEVAHLLVHGILHLLGYDHSQPQDERIMRAREEEILTRLGYGPGEGSYGHPST